LSLKKFKKVWKSVKKLGLKTAFSKYGQKIAEAGAPDYELMDIKDILGIL
jgi:co-chaperonin GroES (HSP10)